MEHHFGLMWSSFQCLFWAEPNGIDACDARTQVQQMLGFAAVGAKRTLWFEPIKSVLNIWNIYNFLK